MKIPVRGLFLSVLRIFAVCFFLYFPLKVFLDEYFPKLLPFVYFFILGIFVGFFSFAVIRFCTFKAKLEGDRLMIKKGFFISRREFLKLSKVVSVKSLTSPLGRLFSVRSLALVFEGSVYIMPPLFNENCNEILLKIKESGLENERL